jgi:hypothetical protein
MVLFRIRILGYFPQKDSSPGTFLQFALDEDISLMRLDNFLRDGQTKSAAFGLGRKEGVEDFFLDLGEDARTGIADLQKSAISLAPGGDGQGPPGVHGLDCSPPPKLIHMLS